MNQTRWNPPISQFIRVKILLLKMVAGWNPFLFWKHRFHILHFPNSTGLFIKPTGCHYTKYRFSPYIAPSPNWLLNLEWMPFLNLLSNLFWTRVFVVSVHETTMNHIPLKYMCPFKESNRVWARLPYLTSSREFLSVLFRQILGSIQLCSRIVRATCNKSQEPWPWNCESPKESAQRSPQRTSTTM